MLYIAIIRTLSVIISGLFDQGNKSFQPQPCGIFPFLIDILQKEKQDTFFPEAHCIAEFQLQHAGVFLYGLCQHGIVPLQLFQLTDIFQE